MVTCGKLCGSPRWWRRDACQPQARRRPGGRRDQLHARLAGTDRARLGLPDGIGKAGKVVRFRPNGAPSGWTGGAAFPPCEPFSPQIEPTPERYKQYEGGDTSHGRVNRCEPPRLLSFMWAKESGDDSEVAIELIPCGENVLLVLTHRRLGDRGTMVSVASGWHTHLGILIDHLDGRVPPPFWSTHVR